MIDLNIPLIYIGTELLFALIFGGHGFDINFLGAHLFGGGLMLGAWFMATDYVTRPITKKGFGSFPKFCEIILIVPNFIRFLTGFFF